MDKYTVLQEIGKGSYGAVYKIKKNDDTSNKMYCWKEINYGHLSKKEREQIVNEIQCLQSLNH